jgi:phage terminase large subunit
MTFLPQSIAKDEIYSGQQILFRGLDDPQSITSITVADGYLCWVWFEEAYQISSEDDFNMIDTSIRGHLPDQLYNQFILTFNPWSDKHWLKKRFFDESDENTFAITTNYKINEFLSESDNQIYEIMAKKNPRRYRIEGLGEWGIAEGLIYENWKQEEFSVDDVIKQNLKVKDNRGLPNLVSCNGIDFGYNDPTAFVGAYADKKNYKIYVYYEYYEREMENRKIANALITAGFGSSLILADSEDPRTINELKLLGLHGIRGARKGAGSVLGGIQRLQDYEIIVHPRCVHTIEALSNYAWKKDRLSDKITNEPEHDFSHIPDALRYGTESLPRFGIQV